MRPIASDEALTFYENDVRDPSPEKDGHRLARFREGWRKGSLGKTYGNETLRRELTWDNLGYRLGRWFGEAPDEAVVAMYQWHVEHQKRLG